MAITVIASGKFLKPMLVFKGTPGGQIEQYKFPSIPTQISYTNFLHKVPEEHVMDEDIMGEWIEEVLKPYVAC